jgi:hypothetical protein
MRPLFPLRVHEPLATMVVDCSLIVPKELHMNTRKSPLAAKELGISYFRLHSLLRGNKITPPQKDSSGDYIWTDEDLERARRVLEEVANKKASRQCQESMDAE